MTETIKKGATGAFAGLTASGRAFPLALAFAGALSLNIYGALACCAVALAMSVFMKNRLLCPHEFMIVPLVFVAMKSGVRNLPITVIGAAVLFVLVSMPEILRDRKGLERSLPSSVSLGLSVGLAFSVTALLTTYYFGIGATGATVFEMLKNYRYLGFHPNWRGVFYGTITLFAMITYPFKFKNAEKYVPAETVSVAIPFVLNLLLNPDAETTPILELGSLASVAGVKGITGFLPVAGTAISSSGEGIAVLEGVFALALIMYFLPRGEKNERLFTAGGAALSGALGGIPVYPRDFSGFSAVSAVVGIAAVGAISVFCPTLLARLPLHSLAVVLIVSAWKRVRFGLFPKMLSDEKAVGAVIFVLCAASFVFLDIFKAMCVCLVLSVISSSRGRVRA